MAWDRRTYRAKKLRADALLKKARVVAAISWFYGIVMGLYVYTWMATGGFLWNIWVSF